MTPVVTAESGCELPFGVAHLHGQERAALRGRRRGPRLEPRPRPRRHVPAVRRDQAGTCGGATGCSTTRSTSATGRWCSGARRRRANALSVRGHDTAASAAAARSCSSTSASRPLPLRPWNRSAPRDVVPGDGPHDRARRRPLRPRRRADAGPRRPRRDRPRARRRSRPATSPEAAWERWQRHGVVQFRQAHYLQSRGRQVLDDELPDVTRALEAAGALRFDPIARMPPGDHRPRAARRATSGS